MSRPSIRPWISAAVFCCCDSSCSITVICSSSLLSWIVLFPVFFTPPRPPFFSFVTFWCRVGTSATSATTPEHSGCSPSSASSSDLSRSTSISDPDDSPSCVAVGAALCIIFNWMAERPSFLTMQPFRNPQFVSMNLSLSVLCIVADPDLASSFIILLILVRMLLYQVSSITPDSTPNNSALSLHSALFFCPSLNVDSVRTYNIGCPLSHSPMSTSC